MATISLTKTDLKQIEQVVEKVVDRKLDEKFDEKFKENIEVFEKKIDKKFATFEKRFEKKMDKKLENFVTRPEFEDMMVAVDERFNRIEEKMLDKNTFFEFMDKIMYELKEIRIEQTATSQRLSDIDDRVVKLEDLHAVELGLA